MLACFLLAPCCSSSAFFLRHHNQPTPAAANSSIATVLAWPPVLLVVTALLLCLLGPFWRFLHQQQTTAVQLQLLLHSSTQLSTFNRIHLPAHQRSFMFHEKADRPLKLEAQLSEGGTASATVTETSMTTQKIFKVDTRCFCVRACLPSPRLS